MTARVRLGCIGAGWWATTNHLPLLAGRDDVSLVSVCRPDTQLLGAVQREFGFEHATEDYLELLDQELDAVLVVSPHDVHHVHAAAALERGLHVLCEKPMTLHADQAWQLAGLAERAGVHAMVPYGWNYKDFAVTAKGLLDEGAVGDIEYVSCQMASPTKDFFAGGRAGAAAVPSAFAPTIVAPDPGTWQDSNRGGGYAHGQLTHASALLFWLTGLRARRVSSLMTSPNSGVDMYDAAHVVFDNGAIGTFSGAATLPDDDKFQLDLRIFGTQGVLLLDVERERLVVRRHDGRHHDSQIAPGSGDYTCDIPPVRFIELITGASTQNNSPLPIAAKAVELSEAMHRSADRFAAAVDIDDPEDQ